MQLSRFVASLLAAITLLVTSIAIAQSAPPLSAYGALPEVEDAAISPNGSNIALLITLKGERQLLFLDEQMKAIRRFQVGDTKIRYFRWVGDDQLILVTSQTEKLWGFTTNKAEFSVARLIPVTYDWEVETVFGRNRELMDAFNGDYGVRFADNRWTAFFGAIELKKGSSFGNDFTWDHGRPFLYQVDTKENRAKRIASAPREGMDRDWLVDGNGKVAATLDVSMTNGDWHLSGPEGSTIATGNERNGRVGLVGLSHGGQNIVYAARDSENIAHWYEIPMSGGQPKPFLEDTDIKRLYFDKTNGQIAGYLNSDDEPVFAVEELQKSAEKIKKAFAGFDMRMVDWTPDFKKVLVRTSGNLDSGSWFVVNLATGKADAIAYERQTLGPKQVGTISTFPFAASDGLEMDGILTLPPGREARNLPVVLLPHGGPHSSDRLQFDWWAQAFASRGYAVFQPNFRGSTNRSQAFKLAGYGEWGRKMQTDISDGLAELAKQGLVDPKRACIVGASYGGYAALAGVTVQQDLYRCAVAVAPVSDIRAMYNEDYRASGGLRITKSSLLDQLGSKDRWDEVSPRRLAQRADAPVLLIHGLDDTVVPYSHSHKMADALKDAGKPFELVTLQGEDHWLSLSSTRLQMLEAAVGFVEKHNPAD